MRQLFTELYNRLSPLKDINGNPVYVRIWNNQLDLVMNGNMEMFNMPAIFTGFSTATINNLMGGDGVQMYDPLILEIHILYWQMNAGGDTFTDGTFEQNLEVFDFKNRVYATLQAFKTSKGSPLNRTSEELDYSHAGVYHFIQRYATTWVDDNLQVFEYGGDLESTPPLELEAPTSIVGSSNPDHVYELNANTYAYIFDSSLDGMPVMNKMQFNTANPKDATQLYINIQGTDLENYHFDFNEMVKVSKDPNNYYTYVMQYAYIVGDILIFQIKVDNYKGSFTNGDNVNVSIYF